MSSGTDFCKPFWEPFWPKGDVKMLSVNKSEWKRVGIVFPVFLPVR